MTPLALLRALPAFLAVLQTVASKPLTFESFHPRDQSQPDGIIWPTDLASLGHDETWSNFTEATLRWSSYEAPSFNEVFLPVTEKDLSLGVSTSSFASNAFISGEICRLKARVM